MSNTITKIGYTSYEHWDAEPETSTRKPKGPQDQIAKTAKGRVMQQYAEQVVTTRDQANRIGFMGEDANIAPETCYIESGAIYMDSNGSIAINKEVDTSELRGMKEALLDRTLSTAPEKRVAMLTETNGLVDQIDTIIADRENEENAAGLAAAPGKITDALGKLRASRNKEVLIMAAFQLLDGFNKLRANDPDKMVELADELQSRDGSITPYEAALMDFVGTHNSFDFSDKVKRKIALAILREYDGEETRRYAQPFLSAHNAQCDKDDPRTFMAEVLARNGLRKDAFQRIVDFNLAS